MHKKTQKLVNQVLLNKEIPEYGLSDLEIEKILLNLSSDDYNNYPPHFVAAVGEREGRTSTALLNHRYFGLTHGVGRSGSLCENQPKAPGSSQLQNITTHLVRDYISFRTGGKKLPVDHFAILPTATGMSISLVMSYLFHKWAISNSTSTKFKVVFSRIDQKSILKAINHIPSRFLELLVVEQESVKDSCLYQENLESISTAMKEFKPDLVLLTTSCFAPRRPDDVALFLKESPEHCAFIVNNAYGLSCNDQMRLQRKFLCNTKRPIFFISSVDKNFLAPVSGAILYSNISVSPVCSFYAGRGSASAVIDTFISLVALGRTGLSALLHSRSLMYNKCLEKLSTILGTDNVFGNGISMCVRLCDCDPTSGRCVVCSSSTKILRTNIAYTLFSKGVTGTRVLDRSRTTEYSIFENQQMKNFPMHCSKILTSSLLVFAVAVGIRQSDLDNFCDTVMNLCTVR